MVRMLGKITLLAIFIPAVFAIYSVGSWIGLNYIFSYEYPRSYSHMIGESVIGAVAVGVLFSYPINKLYGRWAYVAGIISCSGVLFLRTQDVIGYWESDLDIAIMGAVESLLIIAVLSLGIFTLSWYQHRA